MPATSPPSTPPAPALGGTATALVAAGDEETRVLLRGLLRLHHCRVVGEADGTRRAIELARAHAPTLVVMDVNLADGSFVQLMHEIGRLSPRPRIVLIAPTGRPLAIDDGGVRPDSVLYRPFRIRQFAEVVGEPAPPDAPPI